MFFPCPACTGRGHGRLAAAFSSSIAEGAPVHRKNTPTVHRGMEKTPYKKSRTRRKRRRPGTAHAEEQASAARRPAAGRWRRLMRLPSWFPAVNGVQAGTFPCACHGTSSEKTPRPARAGSSRAKPCRPAPRRRMASGFPRQRRRKRTFPPPPLPGKRAPAPERQRRKKRVPPRRPAGTDACRKAPSDRQSVPTRTGKQRRAHRQKSPRARGEGKRSS